LHFEEFLVRTFC